MFWKQVVGLSYKQVLISYKPLSYKKKACIVRKSVSLLDCLTEEEQMLNRILRSILGMGRGIIVL